MLLTGLVRYGYLVLFAGAMVEGDAFLLTAAFLAHRGYLQLALVIAVAAAGTVVADQAYYQLARARGRQAFERKAATDRRFERVRGWIDRRGPLLLFFSRFMYGFRIAIPVACGAAGMRPAVFLGINILGSLFWAAALGVAGYALGNGMDVLLADVRRYEMLVAAVLFAGALALAMLRGRELPGRLRALFQPAQAATQYATRLFTTAHQAGRLALAHAHVRLAAFVVGIGLLNICTALFHWRLVTFQFLDNWLPLEIHHASRAGVLVVGVLLVSVGRGLARRKRAAWTIAVLAALASVALHLGHHASVLRSALSAWLALELVRNAHRFTARSDPMRMRQGLIAIPVLVLVVISYGVAGFHRMGVTHDTTTALRMTLHAVSLQPLSSQSGGPTAVAFGQSIGMLGVLGAMYVLGALLAPVAYRRETAVSRKMVADIAAVHGVDSLSYFASQPDKSHVLLTEDVFAGYRLVRRVAVVAGDPVGPPERVPAAIARFVDECARNDWVPVFYEASGRWLDAYAAAGLRWFKVGEEAVLLPGEFSLAGSRIANVRHSLTKVEREVPGIKVSEYRPEQRDPEVEEQLEDVSAEWLQGKGANELGFNLGVFSAEELTGKRTMMAATPEGYVWAFVTWLPYRGGRALVLDAMRRRHGAPAGVMDLLIARSLLAFGQEGLEVASLATAPLANVSEGAAPSVYDRGVRLIFEHFSSVYGYRSLFFFKKKFNPRWESRYLVFPRPDLLPRIAYALAAVHVEGGLSRAARQLVAARLGRAAREHAA